MKKLAVLAVVLFVFGMMIVPAQAGSCSKSKCDKGASVEKKEGCKKSEGCKKGEKKEGCKKGQSSEGGCKKKAA
jgi:hypothetical protein